MPISSDWEKITTEPLGEGGQSKVFLVRRPERTRAREKSFETLRLYSAINLERKNAEAFAEAAMNVARNDYPSELAALKLFNPRSSGLEAEQSAHSRLRNEIQILKTKRPGFLQLLDSNETLDRHLSEYRGKALKSLLALIPLLRTVAELHGSDSPIVHRDIKPQNIFIGNSGELLLGDFGIAFLPNQPERLSFTGESVGPRDFMPPWIFLGEQPGPINPTFDVYMLGKLLWCMVSGRLKLHREDFREPALDLTHLFQNDPDMYVINHVLGKCVVARERECLGSARELLLMVQQFAQMMQQGGQLLRDGIPRPCRVCGNGAYVPQFPMSGQPSPTASLQLHRLVNGVSDAAGGFKMEAFACRNCGHIQFFKVL
jgi:serine/threonine protein kinase